jgi:hypothetical protein
MPDTARAPAPARPHDSKAALLEAAQAAVQDVRQKEAATRERRHSSRVVLLIAAGALFALSIYLLAVRPDWFFTPPPPGESMEIQDASVRLMLAREAERVRQFAAANGRLPVSLAEAGSPVSGVEYERADNGFVLRTHFAGDTLALRSTDSLPQFLGNSVRTINDRVRQ